MFRKLSGLLCAILLLAATAMLCGQDLVPTLLDQGLKLYAARDYRGAADYLGQVVDMAKEHDQARFYLTYSLALSGNRDKALEHARILTTRHPDQKQYSDLVKQLEDEIAKAAGPKEQRTAGTGIPKEVMVSSAEAQMMVKPRVSTQTYDIKPERPRTPIELAINRIDEGDNEGAEKMLLDILAEEPTNSDAHHYIGVLRFNAGLFQEAIQKFEEAIKANPNSFQSLFLLGDCYRALDEYAKAEEQFRKAIAIKEDSFAMLNLADVIFRQNRIQEAEDLFVKVNKKDPRIDDALTGLAQIRLYRGFTEEASKMINEVISRSSSNPEAHYIKCQILMESKYFEQAAEEANRALTIMPGNTKYRAAYAMALVRSFSISRGLEEAASIISDLPDNIDARLVLAEGLVMSGASGDAEEHLLAVEKRMQHPLVSKLRALMAIRTGNVASAKDYYRQYMQRSPGQPGAAIECAQYLESNDEKAEALQIYREISEQFKETAYAEQAAEGFARLDEEKRNTEVKQERESRGIRPGKMKF
jgi:tetratricopeptide (TPR) repeat protein